MLAAPPAPPATDRPATDRLMPASAGQPRTGPQPADSSASAMTDCQVHLGRLVAHLRAALLQGTQPCERCHVLFTDGEQRYLGGTALGTGGAASLVLKPRDILKAGFMLGARGMLLAHNHPSGDCRPSRADIEATERLAWLGRMVDIALLDHFIVTSDAVYSMRAGGLI